MKACPQHTFLVLTKRPEKMKETLERIYSLERLGWAMGFWNHVWLGVTAENQEQADKRIPILLQTPAAKHFVSIEPMLSQIVIPEVFLKYLDWGEGPKRYPDGAGMIDWVICGGESGPGARPTHPDWIRSLRDQCVAAGTPFLFKQWGEWWPIDGTGVYNPDHHDSQFQKTPPYCWITGDGDVFQSGAKPDALMLRLGKKKAGRLLDGRLWDEYPGGTP